MNRIRRYSFFACFMLAILIQPRVSAHAQSRATALSDIPQQINPPFQPGEKLHYKIRYGFINAADGTLSVEKSDRTFRGQEALHLKAEGKTISAVALFMKVRNKYESFVSTKTLMPFLFTESVKEGSYTRDSYVRFDRDNKIVNTNKGTFDIHKNALDVLSTFYYARSLDVSDLDPGESIQLYYFIDDKEYSMVIKYLGKETIKTDFGRMECLKFTPSLIEGRIFRRDSDMFLWITNDANRIPVKAKVEILVGSLTLDLKAYENLKYPMGTSMATAAKNP
ncbi:MAG: DUF3108 domain-containing protein [Solitalea sp.]